MTTCLQEGSGNGFVIDENGKYQLAPLRLPELLSVPMSAKKSEKKCVRRKYIPIKPEKFNFGPCESSTISPSLPKKRKIDRGSVRKELFTVPQRKSMRNSLSKQQPKNVKSKPIKKSPVFRKQQSATPLIKIDEDDEPLQSESFSLKPLKQTPVLNKPIMPLMDNDEAEELKSEQIFIMNEIKAWIQEEKEEFEIYQKRHHEKLQKLEELLDQFKNNVMAPARTSTKKSKRIMFLPSPAAAKKIDLRKIALNNNLNENLEYQLQSPRTKKAAQMYNNFRCNYSVLCTPKFERHSVEVPQASVSRSLSRRIQKQCLMLQDTPKQNS